ncbi:MAG: PepSY-associated TM helix domain-containing protein [Brevundimonas sp.]
MGVLRKVHAWAGAILSLLLMVLGLTGTLLVFEDDWLRLTVPEARAEVLPAAAQLGAVAERLEAEHRDLRSVNFAGAGVGVQRLYLQAHRYGYADQSGRTLVAWHGAARPEAFVFDLHHELMAGETGERVGGIAALAAVLLVLTGLVVWAPAWRATRLRVWPRSKRRADMVSSHRNLGLITAVPILIFCLTGAGLVFHDQARAILAPGAPLPPEPPTVGTGDIDWPLALAEAQARFPAATLRMAGWPAAPGKPASIRLKQPGEWHPNGRTTVLIDPATSRVVQVTDAQRLPSGLRATNALYPVHAASVGGWPYRLVTALSGLALALLGGVGTWSFLIKPRRKRRTARQ